MAFVGDELTCLMQLRTAPLSATLTTMRLAWSGEEGNLLPPKLFHGLSPPVDATWASSTPLLCARVLADYARL